MNKAIFLDRDGVINEALLERPCVTNIENFTFLPDVFEAIKLINSGGYLCIVITNQPGVAQGKLKLVDVHQIHFHMMKTVEEHYGKITDTLFCPHHPERGWPDEDPEFKIQCNCRKPLPGLLLEAASNYNIDLTKSWMIGDRIQDEIAGKAAGCKTVRINTNGSLYQAVYRIFTEDRIISGERFQGFPNNAYSMK